MMKWICVNNVSLRYELAGPTGAPVVLLIHEMGGTLDSWDECLPALQKEFRTLRYDQRGCGLSQKVSGALDIGEMVDDLVALLDALKLTAPVYVVGSALGAGIAAAFAARHPERVARLAIQSLVTRSNPATRPAMEARAKEVESTGMSVQADASMNRAYPEVLRGNQERFEQYRTRWIANDPYSFAAINRMLLNMNLDPELGNITAPTLSIGCKYDVMRPPALVAEMSKLIPGARFVEAESGHFMHAQTPELFTSMVVPFLKG